LELTGLILLRFSDFVRTGSFADCTEQIHYYFLLRNGEYSAIEDSRQRTCGERRTLIVVYCRIVVETTESSLSRGLLVDSPVAQ
jgi:hypothetical protein